MDPTLDPYNFYGRGSGSDPFNYYAQPGYSTQFAPAVSPYGDRMVGANANPQASYYSPGLYNEPSGESVAGQRSPSQIPGTSGAPSETPSATPGGVSSGAGTGYPGTPHAGSFFGSLAPGQRNQLPRGLQMGMLGMRMMTPQQQPFSLAPQSPYGYGGMNYLDMLRMTNLMRVVPQMQYGGFPQAGEPVLVGERGPELFVPNVPGSIVPNAGLW